MVNQPMAAAFYAAAITNGKIRGFGVDDFNIRRKWGMGLWRVELQGVYGLTARSFLDNLLPFQIGKSADRQYL